MVTANLDRPRPRVLVNRNPDTFWVPTEHHLNRNHAVPLDASKNTPMTFAQLFEKIDSKTLADTMSKTRYDQQFEQIRDQQFEQIREQQFEQIHEQQYEQIHEQQYEQMYEQMYEQEILLIENDKLQGKIGNERSDDQVKIKDKELDYKQRFEPIDNEML